MNRRSFLFRIPAVAALSAAAGGGVARAAVFPEPLPLDVTAPRYPTIPLTVFCRYRDEARTPFEIRTDIGYVLAPAKVLLAPGQDPAQLKFTNESEHSIDVFRVEAGLPPEWVKAFEMLHYDKKVAVMRVALLPVVLDRGNSFTFVLGETIASLS